MSINTTTAAGPSSSYASPLLGSKRIYVVGATGSGKTTLGKALGKALQIPFVELDDLNWDANWTPSPQFEERVRSKLLPGENNNNDDDDEHDRCWIVDGNYRKARGLFWDHVDTVVWLDYPIWVNFYRLFLRCWKRWWYQIPLWRSGCTESIWTHFTSPGDSLLVWLWRTHPVIHDVYDKLQADDNDNNEQQSSSSSSSQKQKRKRRWIHFTSPKATDKWLKQVQQQSAAKK